MPTASKTAKQRALADAKAKASAKASKPATAKPASRKASKPTTTKRKPAKRAPRKPTTPDFAKSLGRDDLGPAEVRWLEQQVNHPIPEKDLPETVGLGSHNPLQGRPF